MHNIAGPGLYDGGIQKSLLLTFPTPTRYETIFWYTGRIKDAGTLLRNKIHAHNTLFEQALFFAASPSELGMTVENGFTVDRPYEAVPPSQFGLKTNAEVKRFLLENLKKSQDEFDARPASASAAPREGCGYPNEACERRRPEIICQAFGALDVIDGFAYDRRQPTCCVPWSWESGQVFTVVGLNRHMGYPVGPHKPKLEDVPDILPGHVGWWFSYDSKETPEQSRWGYSLYNHDPAGGLETPLKMATYQKIAMYINKYSSPNFNDWTKTPHSVPALIISAAVLHPYLFIGCLLAVIALCCFRDVLRRFGRSDASHKKNDSCGDFRFSS